MCSCAAFGRGSHSNVAYLCYVLLRICKKKKKKVWCRQQIQRLSWCLSCPIQCPCILVLSGSLCVCQSSFLRLCWICLLVWILGISCMVYLCLSLSPCVHMFPQRVRVCNARFAIWRLPRSIGLQPIMVLSCRKKGWHVNERSIRTNLVDSLISSISPWRLWRLFLPLPFLQCSHLGTCLVFLLFQLCLLVWLNPKKSKPY